MRWIGQLGDQDLDPQLLLWDMHRGLDRSVLPGGRTVIHFRFPDVPPNARDWWLVATPEEVDVCDEDPGHSVSVDITASLRGLTQVWLGDLAWADALRSGIVRVDGPEAVRRAVPTWFTLSVFAAVPRPEPRRPAPPPPPE